MQSYGAVPLHLKRFISPSRAIRVEFEILSGIEEDKWASACVLIDKLDKVQTF